MKLAKGDMLSPENWDAADLVLITANATVIYSSNKLVMGAGIAKQIKNAFPGIDKRMARWIDVEIYKFSHSWYRGQHWKVYFPYHLLTPGLSEEKIGLFQVKDKYWQPARLDLIKESTRQLNTWLLEHPMATVHLNYPGIGFGKLSKVQVLPIIEALPDNVVVWEF